MSLCNTLTDTVLHTGKTKTKQKNFLHPNMAVNGSLNDDS